MIHDVTKMQLLAEYFFYKTLKNARNSFNMERCRPICPITVFYFTVYVLSLRLKTVVGQQWYKFYHIVILSPFWVTYIPRVYIRNHISIMQKISTYSHFCYYTMQT